MKTRKTIVGSISPEALEFTAGKDIELDLTLAEADCIGSAAHVTMLSRIPLKQKLFSKSDRKLVIAELVNIMRSSRDGSFKISREDQDVHLAIERILTARLGDLGKKIHTARSRNDQIAVDLRLYGKEQLFGVFDETADLALALLKFAGKYVAVPMVGRTHLQPAMPSSVALWASAHAESLLDDVILLKGAYEFNDKCPLGSAAGYGVSMNIDRKLTAKLLGFSAPIHNVLYAANARGKCESVILSALSQVMLTLSRLAEDLILYSMPEFGYFTLPAEYCTGSSIMPQKKNPDVAELVRAKASVVLGHACTVAGIVNRLPSGYNRDLQEAKGLFIEGVQTTRACLRAMASLMNGLSLNKNALLVGFTPDVFAADKALELVVKGMPFRTAYDHVKSHLDELGSIDPNVAVADKKHLGAPGGLDLGALKSRAAQAKKFVSGESRKFRSSISRLLGARYPQLHS
jgi:argininosuccinate lyase